MAASRSSHDRAPLSLTRGGPLFRALARARLAGDEPGAGARLALVFTASTYVPMLLFALGHRLLTGTWDEFMLRSEVHVRLLLAQNVLFAADYALERRGLLASGTIARSDVLPAARAGGLSALVARLTRVRDAPLPELLLGTAVVAGLIAGHAGALPIWLLRWLAPSLHDPAWSSHTAAFWWYSLVSQPLFLFLVGRWLFRWILWIRFVWAVPGFDLRLRPAHADRVGGIAALATPLFALRLYVFALASTLASVWFDQIAQGKLVPSALLAYFLAFVALSFTLAALPYAVLPPGLVAAKLRAQAAYSALLRAYVERFEERWMQPPSEACDDLLGHPDFSGLADLGSSYAVVGEMRSTLLDRRELAALAVAAILPFVPVVLTFSVSLPELARAVFARLLHE